MKAYATLNQLIGQQPMTIGFSLGGYLAQLFSNAVNFSGSGTEQLKEVLQKQGYYEKYGISSGSKVVNIGSQWDPIFNYLGPRGISGHVTGNGGTFHLEHIETQNKHFDLTNHFKFWAELAKSSEVVSAGSWPHYFDQSFRRGFEHFSLPVNEGTMKHLGVLVH